MTRKVKVLNKINELLKRISSDVAEAEIYY
jgi:hypothetical protein